MLDAVRNGSLSTAEACRRYMLSVEELAGWQSAFERDGIAGLQLKSLGLRRRAERLPGTQSRTQP